MREKPLRRAAARDVTLGGSVSQIIALAWKSCEFAHFPQIQPICFLRATPCEAVSHLQRVSSRGPASQPEASVCPVTPASSGGGSGGSGALPSPHSARTPGRCCPAGYDSSPSSVWGGRCSQLLGPARAPLRAAARAPSVPEAPPAPPGRGAVPGPRRLSLPRSRPLRGEWVVVSTRSGTQCQPSSIQAAVRMTDSVAFPLTVLEAGRPRSGHPQTRCLERTPSWFTDGVFPLCPHAEGEGAPIHLWGLRPRDPIASRRPRPLGV